MSIFERDKALPRIHADHLAEKDRHILTTAEDGTDRPRDLGGRENGGRNLVKERLEQVMIASVDDRNRSVRTFKVFGQLKAGKAAPYDNNPMLTHSTPRSYF